MEAVITALISGLCVAIPSIIATVTSNKKNNELVLYRINELDQKVHEHNNLIDRMYKVESRVALLEKNKETSKKWINLYFFFGIIYNTSQVGGVFLNRKKNYQFKYHEYMIEHILKSQYILNNEKREKDIFRLILKGKNCKQIADIVGYSERTIQNRRKEIYYKTLQFM